MSLLQNQVYPSQMLADALEAVINGITQTLQAGDTVALVGFGTFSVSDRAARTGRNPTNRSNPLQFVRPRAPSSKAGKIAKRCRKLARPLQTLGA